MDSALEKATIGGGCFWCVEAVYKRVKGVHQVVSGYAGGHVENPGYKQVCYEETGHAEVVQISYDPELVTYRELLEIFFTVHDPTQLNRQGADRGTQYRSIILYHDEKQKTVAEELIGELEESGRFDEPIVTELKELDRFYPAEDHHQDYFKNNPGQPYCLATIPPKLKKLESKHAEKVKSEAEGED